MLGDETTKMFLNPYSDMSGINSGLANFLQFLIDGKPVDEFTERLVEVVETVKNNIMLDVEYKAFCAKQLDVYDKGRAEGLKAGLLAMVKTLKIVLKDFDKIYDAVVETEEYADITREEVMECYRKCP